MGLAVLARRGEALCAALALASLALLLSAPPAGADLEFCPQGEGAGQCGAPLTLSAERGLAIDAASGRLYVADETNNRVNVFEVGETMKFLFAFGWGVNATTPEEKLQTCTTATGCQKGTIGLGAGQLDRPTSVAVDPIGPSPPSPHAIYVSERGKDDGIGKDDREHPRVQKFDPTGEFVWMAGKEVDKTDNGDLCTKAEGHTCGQSAKSSAAGGFFSAPLIAACPTGGVLYAVDNVRLPGDTIRQRLQRFEPPGTLISLPATLFEGNLAFARSIALDATCNLWVTGQGTGLRKYDPVGNPLAGSFEAGANFTTNSLAIDAAGDLYAGQTEGSFNVIAAFHPTGELFRRFAYTSGKPINGFAAHTSSFGELFFSKTDEGISYVFEPPPGPVVASPSLEVKGVGSAKATLVAKVNPEDKETSVHFEYVAEATYLQDIADLGPGHGFDHAKSTPTKPLGATGFDLNAFEDLAGCPNPAAEAGEPGKCLVPETKYRWRIIATNADGNGNSPVEGPPFTTKPSPELGEIWATGVGTDTARLHGEVNPGAIPTAGFFEYVDDAAYQEDIGAGGDGFAAATKAPAGAPLDFGSGDAFATRQVTIYPLDPGTVYHFRLVADNPLVEPKASGAEELRTFVPPESEDCPANRASRIGPGAFLPDCRAYEMVSPLDKAGGDIRVLRTNELAEQLAVLEQSSLSGDKLAYGSLRSFGDTASAPYTSQYIARRIEGEGWQTHSINSPRGKPVYDALEQFEPEFRAFSADLCDAWQTTFSEPPLATGALAAYPNLYRRTDELCAEDGKVHYEALAPLNAPASKPAADFFLKPLLGISADGSHAIFLANDKIPSEGSEGQWQLYEHVQGEGLRFVCILPEGGGPVSGSCTAGSGVACGSCTPGTQIGRISDDGERIFWATPQVGDGKLYVRIGGAVTVAVSKDAEELSGTNQSRFWGAARDGSKVIFSTSTGPGISDLYEFDVDAEATTLIAKDARWVMGMSEDTKRLYFASGKVLTGEEKNSHGDKAQEGEANLYLREAGGGVKFIATLTGLDAAQVTPDGAHVAFVSAAPLTGYDNTNTRFDSSPTGCGSVGAPCRELYRYDATTNELLCVSCNPSGARPEGASRIPFLHTPIHAVRVLSDDGNRVFFESADSLAARDTNGQVDIYQWEERGAEGCDEEDAAFSPASGGCVELISSGLSPLNSRLVETSPSGDDAFFATVASLLPQDIGVFDIYDARVGGGLPIPPTPKPPCEGDACHTQIPPPEEPTPASSDYVAPPEAAIAGKPRRRCAKRKRRVSTKGKSRCVAKHKRQREAR